MNEKTWILTLAEGVDKNKAREKAPTYLSPVDQKRIGSFTSLDACYSRMLRAAGLAPTTPECVEDICYKLGIVSGVAIPSLRPKIIIVNSARGAAVDPTA
jgi:phosphoglycerate dehydrogenase-like enzyme